MFGVSVLLVYVVLCPAWAYHALFARRHDLQAEGCSEQKDTAIRTFGFMTSSCKPKYYHWHLWVMMRKISVAAIIVLTKQWGIIVQAMLVMMLVVSFLLFQVHCN